MLILDINMLPHSQYLNNSYYDMSYDDYDNDSEVDLFVTTQTDHPPNSNKQDTNTSLAMSSSHF